MKSSFAQAKPLWPSKPVTIVVPFPPGGANDNLARLLSDKLAARLGTPVIAENKGGAGGTIGTRFVTRSAPDGYTLLFCSVSITTNPAVEKQPQYDPVKDLQPIGAIATSPLAVVVSNELPVKTLAEFIDYAKSNPGTINYGSAGVGGMNHLATELLAYEAGVKLTHVPYKGIGGSFADLIGGRLQLLLPSIASVVPYIRDGRLRGLAVTGRNRSDLLPDLPTVSEAGIPGFELESWYGLLGPAGMPSSIVQRLNTELNTVLNTPDVRKRLALEGATAIPNQPEALGTLLTSEIDRWQALIKNSHLKL